MKKVVGFFARAHGLNALETLINNPDYKVVCVFTHRLNPASEDPAKKERSDFPDFVNLTKKHGIPLYTVDNKAEEQSIEPILKKLNFDFIASVSWRRKIPVEILDLAKEGSVNLHRGLLPKYPGAEPIKQALQNKEETIAITAHEMTEEIDAGTPLAFYYHDVNFDQNRTLDGNIERLKKELTPHFGPLLIEALEEFSNDQFKIKWILIDFDGTLVNSLPVLKQIYLNFLKSHGQVGSDGEFNQLNGLTLKEIAAYLKQKYRITDTIEHLHKQYGELIHQQYKLELYPNAKKTLNELHKMKLSLAIVSSAPQELIQDFLKKNQLEILFSAIITPLPEHKGKPHPDLYTYALQVLKIKPNQALVIEDSENGLQAALKANLPALHFNSDKDRPQEGILAVKDWDEVKLAIQSLRNFYEIDVSE